MKLKMWYWSCVRWVRGPAGIHYYNVIRYAESDDGFSWTTDPHIAIEPAGPDEFSIGRPSVIVDGGVYRMWYSVRSFSKRYSIGYAESDDGIHWVRKDQMAGMERSADGWDSEMVCYPAVAKIGDELHMFYNGNQHGATGFGHAVFAP